jgi:glutathione S-transferase
VFYGSCFEPAVVDKAMKREPAPPSTSPYGTYDTMMGTLTDQLAKGPYILGEKFSAADVLWGGALGWTTMFKIVEATPLIQGYIDRVKARPGVAKAAALDAELAAEQDKAAKK